MDECRYRFPLLAAILLLATACGSGGGGGSDTPPVANPPPPPSNPPPPSTQGTSINLASEPGDLIGAGRDYSYDQTNARVNVTYQDAYFSIRIDGAEYWNGHFQLPSSLAQLEVGNYDNLTRYPFHDAVDGGMAWSGESKACNSLTASLTINEVVYQGSMLMFIDLEFEQHCEGGDPALHGAVRWDATDTTSAPGPADPPPDGLWAPADGVTPAAGNYIYLESETGDYIGQGQDYLYTLATAEISVSESDGHLSVSVRGDERWNADFQAMFNRDRLERGYYDGLERYPFHDLAKGGLSWTGENRGCNTLTGWFVVDDVTYVGGELAAIDLRFEQHCGDGTPALNGEIHWDVNDTTGSPAPVNPPPAGLWEPIPGSTPDTVSYVYLESEPGDTVGDGETILYTQADVQFTIYTSEVRLNVELRGRDYWNGTFVGMYSQDQLEVGYYGELQNYTGTTFNPAQGSLFWYGAGPTCITVTGWFVVDAVTYDENGLASIKLRFAQYCDGSDAALFGEIYWDASDTTLPPGPIMPPPAGLWEPNPGATPASGNFVYLESEPGDVVGEGGTYLYTQATSVITVNADAGHLSMSIRGNELWIADFQAMLGLDRLEAGYYPDPGIYPLHDPTRGGLSWQTDVRECDSITGWFVVDSVTYNGDTLTAIDLRFEQHCDGDIPALYGAIRWDANDSTNPPGPVVPPPAGLWEPAPGATPDSGIYIYLESEPGDYIGQGQNHLHTESNTQFLFEANEANLQIEILGDDEWAAQFQGMYFLSRLEAGYYGDLLRFPFHNPAKGGLIWYGTGRGCANLTGWFVIDSVAYEGMLLSAIDLRFAQYCDGSDAALFGEIHWDAYEAAIPPGPVTPIPENLWEPADGVVPGTGNYVYLESEVGDYIGEGRDYLYTDADTQIGVSETDTQLSVSVSGSETWRGEFKAPDNREQLEVGYYGDVTRWPFHDPLWGGLSWTGEFRGCNTVSGWFVVDSVSYVESELTVIEIRFEQHCGGQTPALYGEIRWSQ